MSVYLDNSATTRVCPEAVEAMTNCMREGFYNPSALYAPALHSEKRMKECREEIMTRLHAKPGSRVIFTSGGTEADNLAILGQTHFFREGKVLYTAGEHPAVREPCTHCGPEAAEIPYDRQGLVDLERLRAMMTPDVRLICCMQVNNETGAIQPIQAISRLRDQLCPQAKLHVDGVQGFMRVPLSMSALKIDSYALSGHKLHAPKGIGALVVSPDVRLFPRQLGGGQENVLRSGTENTPGIAGLLAAIRAYPQENRMRQVKLRLWQLLREAVPGAAVNGPDPDGDLAAPHILNVSLPPVRSETMLHALEGEGIYVGVGSACSSHKQKVSGVLKAMNVPAPLAESALRFSLCPDNTVEEMEQVAEAIRRNHAVLAKYQRR